MSEKKKKRKKIALGRGLDALLPEMESPEKKSKDYFECNIDLIRPNRYQPRIRFSEEELQELAQSIREQGVIQPVIVRKDGTGFELVAGERRLRASKLAGLTTIPVIIKNLTDSDLLEISIVENIQREDLNPMEKAEAYHRLIDEFDLTQDEAAKRVGKSRPSVANFLRLRRLPEQIKESILNNEITMGHARALVGLDNAAIQRVAWKSILKKGISVRETENLVKRLSKGKVNGPKPITTTEQIHLSGIEEELSRIFGTKVAIKRYREKGKVEIEFFSDEDLNRLLDLLKR